MNEPRLVSEIPLLPLSANHATSMQTHVRGPEGSGARISELPETNPNMLSATRRRWGDASLSSELARGCLVAPGWGEGGYGSPPPRRST